MFVFIDWFSHMEDTSPGSLNVAFLSCMAMYIFQHLVYQTGAKKTFGRKGHSFGVCSSSGSCLQEETDSTIKMKGLIGGCGETGLANWQVRLRRG